MSGSGEIGEQSHALSESTDVNNDGDRAHRLHDRTRRKETQLLSTQLFLSLCDQVMACTDKNNAFLTSYEQSIDSEEHNVSQSEVESFLIELDDSVKDITVLYNELLDLNKDKPDKVHEHTYTEFIDGVREFKASIASNQETEQKLLEEERRLEDAQRDVQEKLKMFREKNKTLRDRVVSQVVVTPAQSPGTENSDVDSISAHSPRSLTSSRSQVSNPDKEWIKQFTRELTSDLAVTLSTRDKQKESVEKRRPKKAVEPDIFSGNPLEFNDWEIDWDAYVEAEELTEKEALRFIKKYLSGKAKECVIGLLGVNTPEAYRQVRRKLRERFATEQDIAGIFKKRLKQWPPIREPDGEKLQEFADFLDHIKSSRSSVQGLSSLDEKEQNEHMCQKLPHDLKLKWVETINRRRVEGQGYPCFADFAEFVQMQAHTYTNPIMKRSAYKPAQKPPSDQNCRSMQRQTPTRSYHTATSEPQGPKKPYCHLCDSNNHSTPNCGELAKKSYQERMEFVSANRLCYRCAKHRGLAKDCKSKMVCETCGKNHATVLHNPEYKGAVSNQGKTVLPTTKNTTEQTVEQQTQSTVSSGSNDGSTIAGRDAKKVKCTSVKQTTYSMAVPVYISAVDGGLEKLVYALLDTASDSCYIDKQVAADIQAEGIDEKVTMVTMNAETEQHMKLYRNLNVRGYLTNNSTSMNAFQCTSIACDASEIPTQDRCNRLPHLQRIANHLPPLLDIPVGLLIGSDCPQAIFPKASVAGPEGEPFAVQTMFGWTMCGGSTQMPMTINCRATWTTSEPRELFQMVEQDFKDIAGNPMSREDMKFLEVMDRETVQEPDGTYVMPLPFRERPEFPNNRQHAESRLKQLQNKLRRDEGYKQSYCDFMNKLIDSGHAEEVICKENDSSNTWYIPHFGVEHPTKKKLRVVFDASAKYGNTSLNDWLLKGPDQMNDLLGILCRFRLGEIAITCDIEQMFYNFKVAERDRDYLRFLWYDNDLTTIKTYRMTRHIFGATSSPGVATYGLRKTAEQSSTKAADFIRRDFYVDDGITSVNTTQEAIELITEAAALCRQGNMRLHKITSNSTEVLASIPESERSVLNADLLSGHLPEQRTLGMQWSTENDMFYFVNKLKEKPSTRRGILSTVAQVYDPMGLVSPITLRGKNILQETCRQKLNWDDTIDADLAQRWEQWVQDLDNIDQVQVSRHIKPSNFGEIESAELHHFADASNNGYGACSYLRLMSVSGKVHCALILSKAKVAPLNPVTIPRMELQGAVTAIRLSQKLKLELNMSIDREYFWCDSTIVLGYIKNETSKFLPYVANRVTEIRSKSEPSDWYHVPGEINPADMPSRGTTVKELVTSRWFSGPEFLWDGTLERMLKSQPTSWDINPEDTELRKLKVKNTSTITESHQQVKTENFSKLERLIATVARLQEAAKRIHNKEKPYFKSGMPDQSSRKKAEMLLIQQCQGRYYSSDLHQLKNGKQVPKTSKLSQLGPFIDECGVLRVGSRAMKSAVLTQEEKRPAIIPKESWLAKLYIDLHHNKVHHQGRLFTQSSLRQSGIWITGAQRLIKSHIQNCVVCRHLRGKAVTQKMGELPKERVEPTPPFTHVGVDTFGPFLVKERRTELKRWCLVFTCMYSRAVHIEVINDLSTDSFMQALRCLQSIRGPISTVFSDAGTNFMGAKPILTNITFKTNTPGASHQGGVWERTIRQIRAIFSKMTGKYASRLDTAALRTAMYEIMHTMNSKPLTAKGLDDPTEGIITPNHLLTAKSSQLQPPPGDYTETEIYGNKMHHKVEQFAREFAIRWRDYLSTIETRQKWENACGNVKVGDVVSVINEGLHRNDWKTGIVESVKLGADGLVRAASVRLSGSINSKGQRQSTTVLERPIQKLILIMSQ